MLNYLSLTIPEIPTPALLIIITCSLLLIIGFLISLFLTGIQSRGMSAEKLEFADFVRIQKINFLLIFSSPLLMIVSVLSTVILGLNPDNSLYQIYLAFFLLISVFNFAVLSRSTGFLRTVVSNRIAEILRPYWFSGPYGSSKKIFRYHSIGFEPIAYKARAIFNDDHTDIESVELTAQVDTKHTIKNHLLKR